MSLAIKYVFDLCCSFLRAKAGRLEHKNLCENVRASRICDFVNKTTIWVVFDEESDFLGPGT